MKKLFSIIFSLFVIGFMLSGCGISGGSAIAAIKFSKPVFYVDVNCATKLDYKVYPSTSRNYRVGYTTSQEGGFSLNNGVITITNAMNFEPVLVSIQSGSLTDSCYVVKKIYPSKTVLIHSKTPEITNYAQSSVYTTLNTVTLVSGNSTTFTMIGDFTSYFNAETGRVENYSLSDSAKYHEVSGEIFNFEMESSDPTVCSVSQDNKNLIVTAGNKVGSAIITVYLIDSNGNRVEYANNSNTYKSYSRIQINVVPACTDSRLTVNDVVKTSVKDEDNSYHYSLGITTIAPSAAPEEYRLYLLDKDNNIIENSAVYDEVVLTGAGNNISKATITKEYIANAGNEPNYLKISITNESGEGITFNSTDKIVISGPNFINNNDFNIILDVNSWYLTAIFIG